VSSASDIEELSSADWLRSFADEWLQGEHVGLFGTTGSGKTHIALPLLAIRRYVAVFGFKRKDASLDRFIKAGYDRITRWPPEYGTERTVLWNKPRGLAADGYQRFRAYQALDKIFRDGGWTVFLDDTGFATGFLKLKKETGVLLNQSRSMFLSMVLAMQQPSSVVQALPSEVKKQIRHVLAFKYADDVSIKAIADVTGYNWRDVQAWMSRLERHRSGRDRWTDFLYFGPDGVQIVRNGGEDEREGEAM
jgi:hypothetical protein